MGTFRLDIGENIVDKLKSLWAFDNNLIRRNFLFIEVFSLFIDMCINRMMQHQASLHNIVNTFLLLTQLCPVKFLVSWYVV